MSGVMGNGPSVQQQPNTFSTQGDQQSFLQYLLGTLQNTTSQGTTGLLTGNPAFPYPTQFGAGLTSVQQNLVNQITGSGPSSASGLTASANQGYAGPAQSALASALSGQPQNYSQYFQNDVAQPLENTFKQQTLPAIQAAFGQTAGGGNSVGGNTGFSSAVGQATENLNQQLTAADTALGTQAITNASNNQISALQSEPALASSFLNNTLAPYGIESGAASLPQQAEQTQLTGQANWSNSALSFLQGMFGTGAGASTAPTTQQGNTVATQGSAGIWPALISAAALAAVTSDPRLKVIKGGKPKTGPALEVLKSLKVKDARYLWEKDGSERPMLMADDVARKHPAAAVNLGGYGFIKPHELIPLLVRGVQELAKAA